MQVRRFDSGQPEARTIMNKYFLTIFVIQQKIALN